MRYFNRDAMLSPDVLDSEPFRQARLDLAGYVNDTDERRRRQRRAPYDANLLKHPDIREALLAGFGPVCAYCESDMRGFDFFDVEHHRPKASAADQKGRTEHLYYVWLGYEWENLFPVCRTCNNAKRNKFPLAGPRGQIGAPVRELRQQEQPLLLDPCHGDIAEHLGFEPSGLARAKSEIGKATIDILTLNREPLVQQRRARIEELVSSLEANHVCPVGATGFTDGWSAYVFAGASEQQPHAGATTLAILDLASRTMPDLIDIRDFLLRWRMLNSRARRLFLDAFDLDKSDATPPSTGSEPPPPLRSPRSRILRIGEIASAERPITEVRIANFKALSAIDLSMPSLVDNPDLVPCMLLLGENATGKSSVLEAIALALLGTQETKALDALVVEDVIGPEDFLHRPDPTDWDVIAADPLSVEVRFAGIEAPATLTGTLGDSDFGGTQHPSKIVLGYGPRRYFPTQMTRRFRAPAQRVRSLFDPMATIANPIGWLRDLRGSDLAKFDAAVRALRIVLMLKDDALIEVDGDRIMIDTAQGNIPLTKMSVGYKSVIAMAIDIIRELFTYYDNLENAHAVVLVDEIETHLHPRWKMRIVGLLRAAFPRVQFILTTHDPLCLRGMYQGEVFVLRRDDADGGIETLRELPNVEGMRADQILTSEYFGLGSTDPETDAKVERYQYLTGKAERSHAEETEREYLAREIESRMMVGATIAQQTQAEAMRLADLDAHIDMTPVRDGDRKRMIEAVLAKLLAE